MTSSGFFTRIVRASGLAGSASYAFATTYALPPAAAVRAVASFFASGKPAPPRPRRPLASISAMSASGPIDRARSRSCAALMSVSRIRYAVLVGKGRLQRVGHLVLVQLVVRWRGALLGPEAGDRDVPGVPAPAARDRRALTVGCAAEVREQRRGGVEVRHRQTERLADPLGRAPRQVPIGLVRGVEHARQPVSALGRVAEDRLDQAEIETALRLGGNGEDRRRERAAIAVRRGLDHPDPVVRRARRDRRPLAEAVAERVRDRDRSRRAGLLAHEARLALEDRGLGLEEERDEAAAPLGQLALLVRVLAGDRFVPEQVLEGPLHAAEDAQHYRSTSPRTMSIEPRIATTSATNRPWRSHGRIWRFVNDGPRIFARNGFVADPPERSM